MTASPLVSNCYESDLVALAGRFQRFPAPLTSCRIVEKVHVHVSSGRNCLVWTGRKNQPNFIAASRTPPWLPSGWGCRGRRLSRGEEKLSKREPPGRGRHRHPLPAKFSTARHWHEPLPDALTLPS